MAVLGVCLFAWCFKLINFVIDSCRLDVTTVLKGTLPNLNCSELCCLWCIWGHPKCPGTKESTAEMSVLIWYQIQFYLETIAHFPIVPNPFRVRWQSAKVTSCYDKLAEPERSVGGEPYYHQWQWWFHSSGKHYELWPHSKPPPTRLIQPLSVDRPQERKLLDIILGRCGEGFFQLPCPGRRRFFVLGPKLSSAPRGTNPSSESSSNVKD